MAFQIKDFKSIVASMLNWMRGSTSKITDFSVGSVARTMLEAPAAEIEELYQQMFVGIREGIAVSVYNSFSFDYLPSAAASGLVRFYAATPPPSPVLIPSGTSVGIPGGKIKYLTGQDATLPAGASYIDIQVTADTIGVASNVAAGQLTQLNGTIQSITSVSNLLAFNNGRDPETDDQRKTRFQGFISTVARGTKAAIAYGAQTANLTDTAGNITEFVATAIVDEPYLRDNSVPIGLINCYIYNGSTGASPALIARAKQIIDGYYDPDGTAHPGYKAAGTVCTVLAASLQSVTVTAAVTLTSTGVASTVIANASAAINAYIQSLPIGGAVVFAKLIDIVMELDGVYNVVFSTPTADVAVSQFTKAVPGTITITAS